MAEPLFRVQHVALEAALLAPAPLRGREAPRELYLFYEHHLAETLGEQAGGAVHLARSRNDTNATVLRPRLRSVRRRLVREVLRLLAVLVRRAERHAGLVMPIYTHHQVALPVTCGHYLARVALKRDLRGLEAAASDLDRSPLGAGAAGGTTLPIDPARTARLLGFSEPVLHSVDAVASRDLVLRLSPPRWCWRRGTSLPSAGLLELSVGDLPDGRHILQRASRVVYA
jgi:argininosuccinate lyase